MELFEDIRKRYYLGKQSIRAIAGALKIHRRIVRQAIKQAIPPKRKSSGRPAVFTPLIKQAIEDILLSDQNAPKKQRHTSGRLYERLVVEHNFKGASPTLRRYLAQVRRTLNLSCQAFVPLVYQPGIEAEVDWYEAQVILSGIQQKVYFFEMRACYSGREFHIAMSDQTQQAFLEAHVMAFIYFNGVFKKIRYDNLKAAVKKVLTGHRRDESERFIALRSHYLFESIFCKPGKQGAHEKGGVEGGVGRFRRAHLVPVPSFSNFCELNDYLIDCCHTDDKRTIIGHQNTISNDWRSEADKLLNLPAAPFSYAIVLTPKVNQKGLVSVKTNQYSVPIQYVNQRVEVRCTSFELKIYGQGQCIAQHPRLYGKHQIATQLDHYLDLLKHKPGAFDNALPVHQAKTDGHWPSQYEVYYQCLTDRYGIHDGSQIMIDVLLLHRQYGHKQVTQAVSDALEVGIMSCEGIEYLVTQAQAGEIMSSVLPDALTQTIPKPNTYDVLLAKSRRIDG